MIRNREAVVLAGGFGTRLAHVVPGLPKPMAPVAGRPFLRYLLDQLDENGFTHVVIADGYKRSCIESYFGNSYRGLTITYSPEDVPLLTGGAAKKGLRFCKNEWVYVLNGDTYLHVDFSMMDSLAFNSPETISALLATRKTSDVERYGMLRVNPDGIITSFNEKSPQGEGVINAGVYLLRAGALQSYPDKFSLEIDFFANEASNKSLMSVNCEGLFIDIGIPDDYDRAQSLLAQIPRKRKLAMFDRDGTINVDTGHLCDARLLKLIPETVNLLRFYSANEAYKIVVITNQAGIAKGLYAVDDMQTLHRELDALLEKHGCRVDAYYYCPHHPDYTGKCSCRKPQPGMLLKAIFDYEADPSECIFYGDQEIDMLAAKAAGVHGVLIERS